MKNLSYLEVREWIASWEAKHNSDFPDKTIELIIAWSGRRQTWLEKALNWFAQGKVDDPIAWVEAMGIGREILEIVPVAEQVILYNPSLADSECVAVKEGIVEDGKIVSAALRTWLHSQSMRGIFTLSGSPFTKQEGKLVMMLFVEKERIVSREALGMAIWGEEWSDWEVDALVARVRRKIAHNWKILTVRGHGFMLLSQNQNTQAIDIALGREEHPFMITKSILPSDTYLTYMNDPTNVRKVYRDLFTAMEVEHITDKLHIRAKDTQLKEQKILCVNSYSYDNVDAVLAWAPDAQICFVHYDERAIDMHKERARELGAGKRVEVWHDDMRASKLKNNTFDLVINDFRLNFNLDHTQNLHMLSEMCRVCKSGGEALISVVVDGRYEHEKYGHNQEKAPINIHKPGLFQADENLVRRCFPVPYYKKYLVGEGWEIRQEFDVAGGREWGRKGTKQINHNQGPFYRRFWVRKR